MQFKSFFFSVTLVSVHVVHPYSRTDTTAAWKKLCFILLDKFDFHKIDDLLMTSCILMSFSVDEMLLSR